jgi:carotenoid cleavage dioxygenase-like enzyme
VLHWLNAYEDEEGVLVLDGYHMREADVFTSLFRGKGTLDFHKMQPQLYRWRLDMRAGGSAVCEEQALDDRVLEVPSCYSTTTPTACWRRAAGTLLLLPATTAAYYFFSSPSAFVLLRLLLLLQLLPFLAVTLVPGDTSPALAALTAPRVPLRFQFGVFNQRYAGLPYRYAYSVTPNHEEFLFTGIVKHDLLTGGSSTLPFGPHRFGSEAPVCPKVGGVDEDDAYLVR